MFSLLLAALFQDPYVRVHDQEARFLHRPGTVAPLEAAGRELAFPPVCSSLAAGRHGEAVPGGGTLNPVAFANPATIIGPAGTGAKTAFVAQVSGSTRNQGVFVHDGTTLTPIAVGCGALGGGGSTGTCGDPAPVGGTFSGFFTGTVFAPAVNENGDVLFFAEVVGGSTSRGLFLYQASGATIVKVADPPVLGSTWTGTVDASAHAGASATRIYFHALPSSGSFVPAGEILVDLASTRYSISTAAGGGVAVHSAFPATSPWSGCRPRCRL